MKLSLATALLGLAFGLAACGGPDVRIDAASHSAPIAKVKVPFERIEVLALSLPSYAQTEEIHLRDETGTITPLGPLWSDDPSRSVTLDVVRNLAASTGQLVAPDPWPFRDPSDVRVDIRLDSFVATAEGSFEMSGQIFVAPEDPDRRDRTRAFAIAVPGVDPSNLASISLARDTAIRELSVFVAQYGLK